MPGGLIRVRTNGTRIDALCLVGRRVGSAYTSTFNFVRVFLLLLSQPTLGTFLRG